jgi:hypothetical protein
MWLLPCSGASKHKPTTASPSQAAFLFRSAKARDSGSLQGALLNESVQYTLPLRPDNISVLWCSFFPHDEPQLWQQRWLSSGFLMMETARTSETLVNFYQTTRCYNPEDSHLRTYRRENLKSYFDSKVETRAAVHGSRSASVEPTGIRVQSKYLL